MNELPKWVKDFNETNKADKYLNTPWETLYDIKTYTKVELMIIFMKENLKEETPTFPKDLKIKN